MSTTDTPAGPPPRRSNEVPAFPVSQALPPNNIFAVLAIVIGTMLGALGLLGMALTGNNAGATMTVTGLLFWAIALGIQIRDTLLRIETRLADATSPATAPHQPLQAEVAVAQAPSDTEWFFSKGEGENEQGPYTGDQIRSLALQGVVKPTSLVRTSTTRMRQAKLVKGLFG